MNSSSSEPAADQPADQPTASTPGLTSPADPQTGSPVVASSAAESSAPAASDTKPVVSYDLFAQLDLRVARVLEAREHPNANKLLLLRIKVGDLEKQIVAGIRGHYEPAALVGRQIVIVNNLAPAVIRGEESNGMLLAASDDSGVVLLQPARELVDGSRIK